MAFPTHRAADLPILFRNRNVETGNSERIRLRFLSALLAAVFGAGLLQVRQRLTSLVCCRPGWCRSHLAGGVAHAPLLIPPELLIPTGSHVGAGCRRGSHIGTGRR